MKACPAGNMDENVCCKSQGIQHKPRPHERKILMFNRNKKDGPVMEWISIIVGIIAIGISFYHWIF